MTTQHPLGLHRTQPAAPGTAWGVYIHAVVPTPQLVEIAKAAEAAGASAIVIPDEGIDRDVYVTLAAIATATDELALMTGITNPHSRHPVVTAAAVASLAELAPGRVVVGLGTGGTMVFAPMGIAPDRPYSSLLEAVDVLTGLLGGERVTHDGEFTVAGAQVPWSPARLPIAIAGRGPRVEQLAIDRADWILCAGRPATTMPELADRVRDPRRSGPPAKIAWGAMTAWTDAGVERLRPYFTFITSNTPRPELHRMGISDAVIDRITDTLHNEGIEAATPLVPDLVLEHYALLGDRASVAARLSAAREQFSPELVLIEAVEQTPEYIRSIAEVADLAGFAPRSALNDSVRQLAG